ncbi:gliding motility-associated C-terminal domain-containing protein [Dyadobacter sp. 32]|uniref:gliding motility-associated C-terminal domain-containing protein n=1 Tax=Dyadobacter sp. 32 TaxID=538966 RepID=UPI0039C70F1F
MPTGEGLQDYLYDWRTPTAGTSDVWYADSSAACASIVFHYKSPQARNGKFTAGIITSAADNRTYRDLTKVIEYREYIQTRLSQRLKKGKIYYAEYYVLRAYPGSIATNNFGAVFTVSPIGSVGHSVLNYTPQVRSNEVVTDTAKWTKISGCFMAENDYEYLTIGNFSNDAATKMVPMFYKGEPPYYLIDDVLVEEVDVPFIPEPNFLGDDITRCDGESYTVALGNMSPYSLLWDDGNTKNNYTIKESGNYVLELSYRECVFKDSIEADFHLPVKLGPDIKACEPATITLKAVGASGIRWQDGSQKHEYTTDRSGVYIVSSTSLQCPSSDTVKVEFYRCPGDIPNVFTPNSDNKNDYFVIDNITLLPWKLEIYNRWGTLVYRHPQYDNSWDGGKLSAGMYYYLLSSDNLKQDIKGWVNILR